MRYLNVTEPRNVGWGHCTLKTTNGVGFCLLLLTLFILTDILNANFLAQKISEINTEN